MRKKPRGVVHSVKSRIENAVRTDTAVIRKTKSDRRSFDCRAFSIHFVKGKRSVAQDDNGKRGDPWILQS